MKISRIINEAKYPPEMVAAIRAKLERLLDKLENAVDILYQPGVDPSQLEQLPPHLMVHYLNEIEANAEHLEGMARTQKDLDDLAETKRRVEQEKLDLERSLAMKKEAEIANFKTMKGSANWNKFKKLALSKKYVLPVYPNRIIKSTPVNIDILYPSGKIERTSIKSLSTPERIDDFSESTIERVNADLPLYQNFINFMTMLDQEGIKIRYREKGGDLFVMQLVDEDIHAVYDEVDYGVDKGYFQLTGPNTITFHPYYGSRPKLTLSFDQMLELKHLGEMWRQAYDDNEYFRSLTHRVDNIRPIGSGSIAFDIRTSPNAIKDINSADIITSIDLIRLVLSNAKKVKFGR